MSLIIKLTIIAGLTTLFSVLVGCSRTIQRQAVINVPVDKAWSSLYDDFDKLHIWSTEVIVCKASETRPYGVGRVCDTTQGELLEDVLEYAPEEKRLVYDARMDVIPFFVSEITNQWEMQALEGGKTEITMTLVTDLWPVFNLIAWPFMEEPFTKIVDESLEEFEYYMEEGKPHPRKQQATQPEQQAPQ